MKETIRKAVLETQMVVARGVAAASGAVKSKQLDDLIASHGGDPKNVPMEELQDWLGPMDEVAKSIRMTSALMNLCNRFQIPLMQAKATHAIGLFINARLTEPDLYDTVKELHDGPDEKIRPGIYRLMLRLGDLTQRKVDWELASPEKKAAFEAWLSGDLWVKDQYDPKPNET